MISTDDLYKELTKYDELTKDDVKVTDEDYKKAMIKLSILNAKLLGNIRTNIVRVMKHFKVPLIEPRKRQDEKYSDKKE